MQQWTSLEDAISFRLQLWSLKMQGGSVFFCSSYDVCISGNLRPFLRWFVCFMAKLEIGRKGDSLLTASRKMLQDALPTTSSCLGLLTLGRKRIFSQHLPTQQDQSSSTLLGEVCSSSIFGQLEKMPWPLSAKWSYCCEFWWSHSSSSANVWMQLWETLPFRLLSGARGFAFEWSLKTIGQWLTLLDWFNLFEFTTSAMTRNGANSAPQHLRQNASYISYAVMMSYLKEIFEQEKSHAQMLICSGCKCMMCCFHVAFS